MGFSATGINAGLSFKKSRRDLALFYSQLPASGAGVFTNSKVKAAPILWTQDQLLKTHGKVRAILVNSGSANAATGKPGLADARFCSNLVADRLGVSRDEVWVASTGVIGLRIPLPRIKKGINTIVRRMKDGAVLEGETAAESILTTDTRSKTAAVTFDLHGVPIRIWGCAKGAGMIHPILRGPKGQLHATMLSFIMTDASVKPFVLQRALEKVTDRTFNCVSVDGDTSTNDFVALLANGASGAPELNKTRGGRYQAFCSALSLVCEQLTTEIAMDGEGASRLVRIVVEGARTEKFARVMASEIASSPLVKTACHGADPNWGRILMAMGCAGVPFDLNRVKIWLGDILVCKNGQEHRFPEKEAIQYLRRKHILIRVSLGLGTKSSQYKTCDFTGHYVGINAGYRT